MVPASIGVASIHPLAALSQRARPGSEFLRSEIRPRPYGGPIPRAGADRRPPATVATTERSRLLRRPTWRIDPGVCDL